MKIGTAIQGAMNDQIHKELESAYGYLAMSAYFSNHNYPGAASWMRIQAREEVGHATKFIDFMEDRGGTVVLRALAAPAPEFASPLAAFESAVKQEALVSASIYRLYELSPRRRTTPRRRCCSGSSPSRSRKRRPAGKSSRRFG